MTFNCTICFESLVTFGEVASALECGHTFHKTCINRWFANSPIPQCPLCKKIVSKNKVISPVFFSSDENGSTLYADSPEILERLTKMEENNKALTAVVASHNKEARGYRKEISELKSELNRVRNQRSYVKMIKRVADLDNDMSDEYMQDYMQKIKSFSTPNLYVHVGALRARQMRAERDILKVTSKYENKIKENAELRDKIDQLHRHIQNIESNRNLPTGFTERKKRKRQQNVIILDSDIEDEEDDEEEEPDVVPAEQEEEGSSTEENGIPVGDTSEDDYITALLPEEESFIVEEHVATANRRPHKRINV
ncbi:hypothetical protein BD770DRAFT_387001 [Pilaira anomala]|nr:hypothetical protein BD770DRAFT_387001 [Pilaira anomala]